MFTKISSVRLPWMPEVFLFTSSEERQSKQCFATRFAALPLNSVAPKFEKKPLAPRVVQGKTKRKETLCPLGYA